MWGGGKNRCISKKFWKSKIQKGPKWICKVEIYGTQNLGHQNYEVETYRTVYETHILKWKTYFFRGPKSGAPQNYGHWG